MRIRLLLPDGMWIELPARRAAVRPEPAKPADPEAVTG